MFQFIKNLFSKKDSVPESRFDLFQPSERNIYSYFDGTKVVHCDPLLLYKKVTAVGQELSVDLKAAASTMSAKIAESGHAGVVKKVKAIFGVAPFDGETGLGLTEGEMQALLDHFLEYCDGVKKNSNPPPTSATETSSPTGTTSGEAPPTTSTSDSSSTDPDPSAEGPPSSPSGPG